MQPNKVASIMSREIISVSPDSLLQQAVDIMDAHHISFLIVAENRQPLGVLTERDMVRLACEQVDPGQTLVCDVMTSPVISVTEDADIFQVYDLLSSKKIRHMVVLDDAGQIAGLATLTDILGGLSIEYFIELKQVDNIMTKNIQSLAPGDTIEQALDMMRSQRISCVVIVHEHKPVGIITERDVTHLLVQTIAMDATVESIMSHPVQSVSEDTFIPQANAIMRQKRCRHLVVVAEDGALLGLISQSDVARRIEEHYIGYLRGVVQQRDRQLHYEVERFSILFEHNPNAVVSYDPAGKVLDINPAFQALTGYSQDQLAGKSSQYLIHPDDLDTARQSFLNATAGENSHVEFRLRKQDGQYADVFNTYLPVYTEDCLHRVYGVLHDISERKRVLKRLRLSEQKAMLLSKALEEAGDSVIITDSHGTIEFVNAAFTRITGYSADEAIGNTPAMLKSGEQDKQFYAQMWHTILNGEVWHSRLVDRRKNGEFYPAEMTISPVHNGDGEITHFVGLKRDMSEHEALEAQFRQAQKMEAIGTLVGGIAHDFNNMLAGMIGNIYLLKQQVQEQPDMMRRVNNIERLSNRAADMIGQLLTFARKDIVRMNVMPLTPFIKETLKFLHATLPENVILHQDICTDPLCVYADGTQMHQILMNLMNNACDALDGIEEPHLSVSLKAFTAGDIFIEQHPNAKIGTYACLSVADNGCGMPEGQTDHIFEPFFTTKEQGKGTGLGLAMVYGAVNTHHGFVDVESIEGEGSTFRIYIPLSESTPNTVGTVKAQRQIDGCGEVILLADDDQTVRETTADVLESMGYRVIKAPDGRRAIEIYSQRRDEIALALLDVVMPHCGGIELAERIRAIDADLPVIFLTGYDQQQISGQYSPGDKVFTKPVDFDALSHGIRDVLDGLSNSSA